MKVLFADDDPITRSRMEAWWRKWGNKVEVASEGTEVWHPGRDALALRELPQPTHKRSPGSCEGNGQLEARSLGMQSQVNIAGRCNSLQKRQRVARILGIL
jgi:hypothetical protein